MIHISLFTPVLASTDSTAVSTEADIIGIYEALCRQSSCEFDWWIIDNTSSSNIRSLAECWTEENRIPLHYHQLPDVGIVSCLNFAIRKISAPLCCYLPIHIIPDEYFIDTTLDNWEKARIDPAAAGIISSGLTISRTTILKKIFPVSVDQIRQKDLETYPFHTFIRAVSQDSTNSGKESYLWKET